MRASVHCGQQRRCAEEAGVKETETIMEILAAYDLTHSFRDAAALVGCAPNTVIRYVHARDAGQLRTTPVHRSQLIDPFHNYIESWVDESHGRVRADVVQTKLEALGLGFTGFADEPQCIHGWTGWSPMLANRSRRPLTSAPSDEPTA